MIKRLVTIHDEDADTFLRAYLNSGAQRDPLVAGLVAAGWKDAFEYLYRHRRARRRASALFGAALAAAAGPSPTSSRRPWASSSPPTTRRWTSSPPRWTTGGVRSVVTMLARTGIRLPDLTDVDPALCERLVEQDRYLITGRTCEPPWAWTVRFPSTRSWPKTPCTRTASHIRPRIWPRSRRTPRPSTRPRPPNLLKVLDDVTDNGPRRSSTTTSRPAWCCRDVRASPEVAAGTALDVAGARGRDLFDATLNNVERTEPRRRDRRCSGRASGGRGAITAVDDGGNEVYDPDVAAAAILNNDAHFTSTSAREAGGEH